MRLWPEAAWWGETRPGGGLWTAQPVGHAIGGVLWAIFFWILWTLPLWAKPPIFAGGMTLFWQLRIWEPRPDGTYPLRWVIWDTLTAMCTASLVSATWWATCSLF